MAMVSACSRTTSFDRALWRMAGNSQPMGPELFHATSVSLCTEPDRLDGASRLKILRRTLLIIILKGTSQQYQRVINVFCSVLQLYSRWLSEKGRRAMHTIGLYGSATPRSGLWVKTQQSKAIASGFIPSCAALKTFNPRPCSTLAPLLLLYKLAWDWTVCSQLVYF